MQAFTMPPGGGVVRYFHCLDLSFDNVFVFVGSSGIYTAIIKFVVVMWSTIVCYY